MSEEREVAAKPAVAHGWGWPSNSRKAHYFFGGRSVCGKWGFFGEVTPDTGKKGPDDCAACSRHVHGKAPR